MVYSTMGITLEPPTGAAGIEIGASRADAEKQCAVHGEPETFRRADETVPSLVVRRSQGATIFVYFDDADTVEAVELGRPDDGESVTFRDLDVFATPADEVMEALNQHAEVEVTDGSHAATAPSLYLAFWRPTVPEDPEDEEGRYFESVLVAAPGYDD